MPNTSRPGTRAPSKRHVYILYAIVYGTMFFFGLIENIKGVSFPLIKTEFGVAYDSQGGLVSMTWFGYVIFCLVASLFLQRFGIKRSISTGYVLICVGALATLAAPSFWLASAALLIVNAGFGFFEVGTNALGTVVFTARAALMMSLMHFFYGFGAVLGPKAAGVLTDSLAFSWRQVYLVLMIPCIAFLLFIVFTRFDGAPGQGQSGENRSRMTFVGALRIPLVWVFILTLGFMEVVEFGASNWGGLHLQDVYGLDPRTVGASFVSSFYILFTLSRLFSGWLIEHAGYIRSLFVAVVCTILLYVVGFGLGRQGIWVLPVTGLFIAIMWPTIMAVAMQAFGSDAPIVTSAIITLSGAVNGVFQLVIGLTNHLAGEAWGYRSALVYALLTLVLLTILARKLNEHFQTTLSPQVT